MRSVVSFLGSVHVSLHEVYKIYDTDMKREGDMEGGSEGDRKGREGGGEVGLRAEGGKRAPTVR